jgi:hypothetical protein
MFHLFAMHDPGAEQLIVDAGKTGYTVHTKAIGRDPNDRSGESFNTFGGKICNIVRLNNGYGSTGTIPLPQYYGDFAQRCANFAAASTGANHWIIGNEIALEWERPEGQVITLANYVDCFKQCYAAIKRANPDAIVIPQPPAPWNPNVPDAPDWVDQLAKMLTMIGELDAIALHTYSHGHDPALITSEECMNPPYGSRHFHFRAYRDFMYAIPDSFRHLPVFITESNPDGWQDANNGWIQAAYAEIDRWNHENNQQIFCLAFYRWPNEDREQFWIGSKSGVVEDFKQALQHDYKPTERVAKQISLGAMVKSLTFVNVRRTPGRANKDQSDVFSSLVEGEIVTVTQGPVRLDDLIWWQVERQNHLSGWVAEFSPDGERLVVPV